MLDDDVIGPASAAASASQLSDVIHWELQQSVRAIVNGFFSCTQRYRMSRRSYAQ